MSLETAYRSFQSAPEGYQTERSFACVPTSSTRSAAMPVPFSGTRSVASNSTVKPQAGRLAPSARYSRTVSPSASGVSASSISTSK